MGMASKNWHALKKKLDEAEQQQKTEKLTTTTTISNNKKRKLNKKNNERNNKRKIPRVTSSDIWFDDVNADDVEMVLGKEAGALIRGKVEDRKNENTSTHQTDQLKLVKNYATNELTNQLAIDCEMVGCGESTKESILARVSIVNLYGKSVYDKYVKPREEVTDFRTAVSGIKPEHLCDAETFEVVQKEVADMLNGRVLIGHAIRNDLRALLLTHPKKNIRDTSTYLPFRKHTGKRKPSLKLLANKFLNVRIQQGEHDSVQDAQATMRLYSLHRKQWDALKNRKINVSVIKQNQQEKNRRKTEPPSSSTKRPAKVQQSSIQGPAIFHAVSATVHPGSAM